MLLVLTNRLQQLAHMVAINNFIYFPILGRSVTKQLTHYYNTLVNLKLIILFIIFSNF
jgi:hypothetical protein